MSKMIIRIRDRRTDKVLLLIYHGENRIVFDGPLRFSLDGFDSIVANEGVILETEEPKTE